MFPAPWNKDPILDFNQLASSWRIRLKDRRAHRYSAGYWRECVGVDQYSREQLIELQEQRLNALIEHVSEHTAFYRDWAKSSGYTKGDPVELADLPIVSKADIMGRLEEFQSDTHPVEQMYNFKTSGSSGMPFQFRLHPESLDYSYCCLWRALHRFGLRPGDRRVYVWGRSYAFNNSRLAQAKAKAKIKVRDWMNVTLPVDAYNLSFENVPKIIDEIEKYQPTYIHGYVSAIYTIARTLVEEGRTLKVPGLKVVVTESEKVYDFQRETMEKAFACPIAEHYGSVEFGNIAEPDPDGNMRINEDIFLVEREETGEAVITSLLSQAFPFIRYKLGDLIELDEKIMPGLPYASFKSIEGRTIDMIPIAGGGHLHGMALAHMMTPHYKHVLKYQIRQIALDHFVVQVIPKGSLPELTSKTIIKDLQGLVGAQTTVEVLEVNTIEPAKSGKFRWVISDIV